MTQLTLRALAPQDMTAAQRREADEQLGRVAAALARSKRRLAGRRYSVAAMPRRGHSQPTVLAPVCTSRRPFDSTATPVAAARGTSGCR
jgi:hypothetical protein